MRDFIYDQVTGKCVATISGGEIFAQTAGEQKVATVRDNIVYDLKGNMVGHLNGLQLSGPDETGLPAAFTQLISGE